jgi:hypothetical protein
MVGKSDSDGGGTKEGLNNSNNLIVSFNCKSSDCEPTTNKIKHALELIMSKME